MSKINIVRVSKFMSLVLRHNPGKIGLELDAQGWASVEGLLRGMSCKGYAISMDDLRTVVAENNKKRFSFNDDETMIRASQGHSIKVELDYPPATPPELLYHGTIDRFMEAIRKQGLRPQKRHHVHLSKDIETAQNVGSRRGAPVILTIDAKKMTAQGHLFYISDNGVWLTEAVPASFIQGL